MSGLQSESRDALLAAIAAGVQPVEPAYLTVGGERIEVQVQGLGARERDTHDALIVGRARDSDIAPEHRFFLARADLLARTVYFAGELLFAGADGLEALANIDPEEMQELWEVASRVCGRNSEVIEVEDDTDEGK